MEPIIRVQALTAGFGERVVLKDLSFEVKRGEVFVIVGGSGSGKSTLLKHLIGLHQPLSGEIRIDGEDLLAARGKARLAILRKFGVSYQSGALFGSMSVLDNVKLPLEEYTELAPAAIELIARMKLDLVALGAAAARMPAELSGGMKKRAAIARAMALDPLILFLDEPSAGLDPVLSAELDALLKRLSRTLGVTLVIVTHELESIYAIADRVIMLDPESKTIIAQGPPAALREHRDPRVRRFFNPHQEEQ